MINGKIEGLDFSTTVVPVVSLGRCDGHDLDAIMYSSFMKLSRVIINA